MNKKKRKSFPLLCLLTGMFLIGCRQGDTDVKRTTIDETEIPSEIETIEPVATDLPSEAPNNPLEQKIIETIMPNLSEENVYIDLDEKYALSQEEIRFKIINNSKEEFLIHLVPQLERKTEAGWEDVLSTAGFCGVPDPISKEIEGILLLEWYPDLSEGRYRVSYEILKQEESYFISKEFDFYESMEDQISIDMKNKKIDTTTKEITLELTNHSDRTYMFGHEQYLEQKVEEEWKEVSMSEGVGWNEIGILLHPNSMAEEPFYLQGFYEELQSGTYRLQKKLYPQDETEKYIHHEIIVNLEFVIE